MASLSQLAVKTSAGKTLFLVLLDLLGLAVHFLKPSDFFESSFVASLSRFFVKTSTCNALLLVFLDLGDVLQEELVAAWIELLQLQLLDLVGWTVACRL